MWRVETSASLDSLLFSSADGWTLSPIIPILGTQERLLAIAAKLNAENIGFVAVDMLLMKILKEGRTEWLTAAQPGGQILPLVTSVLGNVQRVFAAYLSCNSLEEAYLYVKVTE